jgi:hypothetical protein
VGFLKQMKDMKATVEAAPAMVEQAQQLGAQAQQMAAAQQAAAMQQQEMAAQMAASSAAAGTPTATAGDLAPIAGVSLEQYAEISRGLAAYGYDQSKAVEVAASKGVSPDNWQQAMDGWNARIAGNPAVGQQFNQLYRAG